MRRKIFSFVLIALAVFQLQAQVESISSARAKGPGASVTISGVITNGNELGVIRYIQDETGGLAVYDPTEMADIVLGDSVTLTGTLVDYNNLLEMQPVSSVIVEKKNATLPDPVVLTPAQLGEAYESMLVKIEDAVFEQAGSTFSAKTNYAATASGGICQVRVPADESPFVGTVIPSGETNVVGILSHFYDTYQILLRLEDDIMPSSSINFQAAPVLSNLSTGGFTLEWETEIDGTTEMLYGHTPDMELGKMVVDGTGTQHSISITGADPSTLYYIWPYSVSGNDTAKISQQVYITQSTSTGDMKAFFNRSVDHSVSTGTDAQYLDHAIDDTLINYINRATETIEFSAYNFNNAGISNIADALNAAHDRGVVVRVVYDINQSNFGTDDLYAAIGKMPSLESNYPVTGIMHNKFIVFDALSDDADKSIVWTGATNFTDGQINKDPNNVVVVQDKSLAIAFRLEFNEMFGTEAAQPDPLLSRFGPYKSDNTPHEFIVGGNRVECYFSPSDNTHTKILETLRSADTDLSIATMLITKSDLAYAIRDAYDAGVETGVLVKNEASCSELVVDILKFGLADKFRVSGESGIMHHKYAIVDQSDASSDPIILTGSHNWSTAAQVRNDENTLIIHNQDLANQYYQEYVVRFGAGLLLVDAPVCKPEFVSMTTGSSLRYDVLYNDELPGPVVVDIARQPTNGTATVESDKTVTYRPNTGFNQDLDTVYYKVSMEANLNISDESMMVVYVNLPVGVEENGALNGFSLYPNPSNGDVSIRMDSEVDEFDLCIFDISGKKLYEENRIQSSGQSHMLRLKDFKNGYYFVVIEEPSGSKIVRPLILQK